MRGFIRLSLLLSGLVFTITAGASNFGLLAGINSTTADIEGESTEREMRYHMGGVFLMDFTNQAYFRTGVIYAQRYFSFESTTSNTEVNFEFTYLEIPSTILYEFNDVFYLFGGFNILANLSDGCSLQPSSAGTCEVTDIEKILVQPVAGIHLALSEDMRLELFYEHGIGNVADGTKNLSTVGFNYMYLTY